jgi:hypothetical protein
LDEEEEWNDDVENVDWDVNEKDDAENADWNIDENSDADDTTEWNDW